jgi:hypothetical protein
MRAAVAVSVVTVLCATAPAFADAQSHVQAAKKAEKRGEWRKALAEWKAAYSAEVNAEYLIGIGDAYSHLGNKAEARKNYEAYLADPLALPAHTEKVKAKVAALDAPAGGGLALPGPGLTLPGPGPGLALPGGDAPAAAPAAGSGLELPAAPVADSGRGKKGKKGKKGADAPPPLPGLELPGGPGLELPGTATASAQKKSEPPPLELPGAAPAPLKVASNTPPPTLDLPLPGAPASAPKPPAAAPAAPKQDKPAVATNATPATTTAKNPWSKGTEVAVATPPKQAAPEAATSQKPLPASHAEASSGGGTKTLAWVAAGVAVVGLGGGAFFYTQSSSAHSDLTGSIHKTADAQSLLDKEKSNKTLSFVGLAAGLVGAGVATALFVF